MSGFPLTGVDPSDPLPGNLIEIQFGQGQGSGAGSSRPVGLLGNKTSAGSESTNSLGDLIADDTDCINRFGRRSEIRQMYRTYVLTDPNATIFAIAVPEGAGTAATRDVTFLTTATGTTTGVIQFVGEETEFSVLSGDVVATIATACSVAFNNMIDWPATSSPSSGAVTVTCAQLGPRGDEVLKSLRVFFRAPVTTTITLAATVSGTTDDDQTTALTLLEKKGIYYQVNPKTTTSAATSTDNGLGEHAAFITSQALPSTGNRNQMICALNGTNGQAATVGASLNNVRAKPIWSENCRLPPPMLAAKFAAAMRSKEIVQAGANLTNYGLGDSDSFDVPPPFSGGDRPTTAELRNALNNGVTPVDFTTLGQSYIKRHVTSRCLNGSQSDFRARSGHYPSALDFAADFIADQVNSVAQPYIAENPVEGAVPVPFTTTPVQVQAVIRQSIILLTQLDSGPVLDPSPSVLAAMLASVEVVGIQNGTSARMRLQAVRHNDKTQMLFQETSPGV
jgi:phage tail sheath gpL-like